MNVLGLSVHPSVRPESTQKNTYNSKCYGGIWMKFGTVIALGYPKKHTEYEDPTPLHPSVCPEAIQNTYNSKAYGEI